MHNFRQLTPHMLASPQITSDDVTRAAQDGVTLIINNRPDGEAPEEPQGVEIEAAAKAAGMGYLAIPITHAGFSMPQVGAMAEALEANDGKILAYCRSGTRSTLLWALAEAKAGKDPDTLTRAAQAAGYDLSPVRPTMDMLASAK